MDLPFISQAISSSPIWFRWAVSIWIISGAILFVRFITYPINHRQSNEAISSLEAKAAPESQVQSITFEEYLAKTEALSDRFLELDEFKKKCDKKSVAWEGYVGSISQDDRDIIIALLSRVERGGMVVAFCPLDLRTKIFSYHKNDHIRITGLLRSSSTGGLLIRASGVEFIGSLEDKK